jgi:hypothetical protein
VSVEAGIGGCCGGRGLIRLGRCADEPFIVEDGMGGPYGHGVELKEAATAK